MQPNQPYTPAPNQDPDNTPVANPPQPPTTWETATQQPSSDYQAPQPEAPVRPVPPSEYEQPRPGQKSQFELEYEAALKTQAPSPKKSRKGLIIGGIIGLIILIAAGASAYAWMQYANNPQTRLYQALENHMSTNYIQQDYKQEVTVASTNKMTMHSISDFSDPKNPKSYIEYTQKGNDDNDKLSGTLIKLDDKEYYAKLTKTLNFSGEDSDLAPKTDQWYRVDDSEAIGGILFDPLGSMTAINTSKGETLVGNFNENARKDLMAFIKENNVYTITNSEEVTVEGEKMTKYDLSINADKANKLNDKATELLGLPKGTKVNDVKLSDGQTNQLWVSNKTNHIVKAEVKRPTRGTKTDPKAIDTSTITISYPTDASKITKPSGAVDVPWN
jgi:hypothetical protein